MGPSTPHARAGTQAEALSTAKAWKTKNTAIAGPCRGPMSCDNKAPSPTATGARITYWNGQWHNAPDWVIYFMALGGEEVLGLQWDRHPNAAEMYYYED